MNEELNRFLRGHRILKVEREIVQRDSAPSWAVCVEYMDGATAGTGSQRGDGQRNQEKKIDYRQVLNEADFTVFSALRDLRRGLADAEGVPVYAIFTNDQLAKFAQSRPQSKADLEKVDGVGGARLEKYGSKVLDVLAAVKGVST